jgi:hypothetical protein
MSNSTPKHRRFNETSSRGSAFCFIFIFCLSLSGLFYLFAVGVVLPLHLSHTHTTPHSVGLLWTAKKPARFESATAASGHLDRSSHCCVNLKWAPVGWSYAWTGHAVHPHGSPSAFIYRSCMSCRVNPQALQLRWTISSAEYKIHFRLWLHPYKAVVAVCTVRFNIKPHHILRAHAHTHAHAQFITSCVLFSEHSNCAHKQHSEICI